MKKWFVCILCALLVLAPCFTAHAACSASVSASQVYVGDTVSVTFKFTETKAVGSVDLTVQFDNAYLTYKSFTGSLGGSMVNAQGETIKISEYNSDNSSKTYTAKFTFTAKAVGSAVVRITICDIGDQDGLTLDTSSASATVTVKAKQNLPSDCNLKSLTPPAGCTLSPKFSPNTTKYTCSVPYSVEKFPLDWELSDSKATATPSGSVTLKVGTNTRSVRVTAQDGTTKTYTVTITRAAAESTATPAPTPVATAQPDIPVTVDGKTLAISRTLHTALPDGFIQETFAYQDEEVESGVMGNLRVVQINDGEESDLYLFDEATGTFSLYHSLETTGDVYTVLDKTPDRLPAGAEKTSVNGMPCFTLPLLGDGYYLVTARQHSTGKDVLAVYCEADGTLQTASAALLGDTTALPSVTNTPSPSPVSPNAASPGALNWTTINALVVAAAVLLLLAVIVLIVLLCRRKSSLRRPRTNGHDWGLDDTNPYNVFLEDPPEPLVEEEKTPAPRRRGRKPRHDWGLDEADPYNITLPEDETSAPADVQTAESPEFLPDDEKDFE